MLIIKITQAKQICVVLSHRVCVYVCVRVRTFNFNSILVRFPHKHTQTQPLGATNISRCSHFIPLQSITLLAADRHY